ncbi:acyl-phosphate glycerol 3-phosphate acyltransferase [Acidihalobacter aeolianus]|uniref:Acyl-phosphate glycerol 3-phosphate acyltransferase n=1 Tax=Acidihalobacter aeolianus TaxID=2792603 RepID=A0A1D8K4I8_9GAMM|nr:lysophospholipid acyltransferase family protein [Acidihalobacter aeolianus]AOV15873.1 acyl-phosphate glycerol 3-phosphate acyltransferase [Acidihalobacter aeolianus]
MSATVGRWRSWLWLALAAPTTIIFSLLGMALYAAPFQVRYAVITRWTRLAIWWLRVTCGIGFAVEGRENLPVEGAAVILAKHQSAWETMAFQLIFPPQVWVLKQELLRIPFFGWGLRMLEPIAIDRAAGRKAVVQLIRQGTERLQRGIWVVVFPEGTRVAPGERGKYLSGGAALAVSAKAPVVPVAHNAGLYWPREGGKHPGTIRVVIGPQIATEGRTPDEVNAEAEAWIENCMPHLLGEAPKHTEAA